MSWSYKMKKIMIAVAAFCLLVSGSSMAAKARYKAFTPTGAGASVFLKSGTYQHKYFVAEKGKSLSFDIVGPAKVKIRTRVDLKAGISAADYEVQVWEGDKLIKGRKVKGSASKKVILPDASSTIGTAHNLTLVVPKGKHSYRLWLSSDQAEKYYVRFYQTRKTGMKVAYSSFKPVEFKKQINLVTGRKEIAYYLIDNAGGATVNVVGPTKLKILCRANFTPDMKGNAKFTLGLFEKGHIAVQFSAVAKIAPKLAFKELKDSIPSSVHEFIFEVPRGKHAYELRKIDSMAPSLAVRLQISAAGLGMKL